MAATIGTMYKVVIEIVTTESAPAKLISCEKSSFTCDSADSSFTRVVKDINGSLGGLHLGDPLKGDRYIVTMGGPTSPIDESTVSIEQLVGIAGAAVDTYEGYSYYD